MLGKTVMTVFSTAVVICICIYMIEMFAPLSKKHEFNTICRLYLVKMENSNGLTSGDAQKLNDDLAAAGLQNIRATGTSDAKRGQIIELTVNATFIYRSIAGIFTRETKTIVFSYAKKSLARLVQN